MAKTHVYYGVLYPNKSEYNPHCFSCAVRLVCHDFRLMVKLETTDYESTKCVKCGLYIKDTIEI